MTTIVIYGDDMGNDNDRYSPRPVEIPSDDEHFYERPLFAYGIFQKGQLAYSRIADCVKNVERGDVHREMHIRDGVPVIKNETSERITKGDKIFFLDGREEDAYATISSTQLGNVYKWDTIDIDERPYNILVTENLKGTFLNRNEEKNYQEYYDGKEDPFFFKVPGFIRAELKEIDTEDDDTIFNIQMYYMLLWTAIDRYCVLKYDVSKRQGKYLRALSEDEIFEEALNYVDPETRDPISSARNATPLYFNKDRPNFIVNFYYTIRSNVVHRGKEEGNNFEALEKSLNDMLDIFDYIIEKTFNDEGEN